MAEDCIKSVTATDAQSISEIAFRSKASWGYSDDFMRACRNELTYRASTIESSDFEFWAYRDKEEILGFYALEFGAADFAELEALFVDPEHFGTGIGRALMAHATNRVQARRVLRILIQSDPYADAFYSALGAIRVGQRESESIAGRFLPLLEISIEAARPQRSDK